MSETTPSRLPNYLRVGTWLLAFVSISLSVAASFPIHPTLAERFGRAGAGAALVILAAAGILRFSFSHSDRVKDWIFIPCGRVYPPITAYFWVLAFPEFPGFGWHPWGFLWTGILVWIGWDARKGPRQSDPSEEYTGWKKDSEFIRLGLS